MSKFVIIGCALLVACAIAEASLFDKIHDVVQTTTNGVESLVNGAVSGVVTGADKITEESNQFIHELSNKTQAALNDVKDDIKSITVSTKSTAVSSCSSLADTLRKVLLSVIFDAGTCVVQKVEDTWAKSSDIIAMVESLAKIFLSAGSGLIKCGNGGSGITGALHALSCTNGVLVNLEWQLTTHLPTVLKTINGVGTLFNSVGQDTANCIVDNTINTLIDASSTVISQLQTCVTERKGTQSTS